MEDGEEGGSGWGLADGEADREREGMEVQEWMEMHRWVEIGVPVALGLAAYPTARAMKVFAHATASSTLSSTSSPSAASS